MTHEQIELLVTTLMIMALELAYTEAEVLAGMEFSHRKARRAHPPGHRDGGGRFHAAERTVAVQSAYNPSRAWPWGEMKAARTADHCAELWKVECVAHVRRIGTALDRMVSGAAVEDVRRLLAPGIKARRAGQVAAAEDKGVIAVQGSGPRREPG